MAKLTARESIQLKQVFFTRMEVLSIPEHNVEGKSGLKYGAQNNIKVEFIEEEKIYVCAMRTILNPEKDPADPYFIDMECLVTFEVHPDLSKEEAVKAVTITGHTVAYGAIREAITWMTGRNPYGPLALGLSWLTPPPKNETTADTVSTN